MESGHLLLIDGLNVLRRVHEAIKEPDPVQKATSACESGLKSFARLVNTYKPSHVLAVFDHEGRNWRHRLYPSYKANRRPMPEALRNALPVFRESLKRKSIHSVAIPDFEADDVLASAASSWLASFQAPVTLASSDKDLTQLHALGVRVVHPFTGISFDDSWCLQRYGVRTDSLPDMLALLGDATDGVPGAKGIGLKTAMRLFKEYGSLDRLLADLDRIPGTTGQRLCEARNSILLSRQLVRLNCDIKIGLSWNLTRFSI